MSTVLPPNAAQAGFEPLSLQQLRLWLECQTTAGNAAYQMPSAVLITGNIDVLAFSSAAQAVISRHALLQCTFHEHQGTVKQKPDQQAQVEITRLDISATDQQALQQYINAWSQQEMPLQAGPLLRVQLAELRKTGTAQYLLLMNIHHLLTDGWSNQLLLQEILQHYRHPETPAATGQADYFAYIRWQQQQLQQGVLAEQLHFWQQQLQDIEALAFPVMAGDKTDAATSLPLPLADVSQLARNWQVTPFALYMAAWHLTLHKLTQQQRFAVITPFANRQREEFFSTIGLFANALPVVADFTRPQNLLGLVRDTHARLQMANANSEVPIAGIAEQWLEAGKGELSLLFTAAINYETTPLQQQVVDAGLALELLPLPPVPAKFPLSLNIRHNTHQQHGGVQAGFDYDQAFFSPAFIKMLETFYQRALQAIIGNPAASVREFSLLNPQEQLALLGLGHCNNSGFNRIGDGNHTQHDLPQLVQLHDLFARQCRKTPAAIAVSCDNYQYSYAELEQQAGQLAFYLQAHYGSGGIIGISLPRSCLVSVALLGILKSGNAYLPLDAQFPPARLQQITDAAQPACIITTGEFAGVFSKDTPRLLLESTAWQAPAAQTPAPADNPLFNVIFTSGSTGTPKGVRVLQQGIINRLLWMQAHYPLASSDVVLQKTPLTFDVSVWELFWPLISGARLFYAKPEGHRDAAYLCDVIRQQAVSTVHFVPSMLDIFLDQAADLPSLRQIFCSGETLPNQQARRCRKILPQAGLYNLYGPTEAAVDVSYFAAAQTHQAASTPIGRPIWNTQLHILDDTLRPLPPGLAGELYIGGIGLAEGYQGNPDLTAERFIDNPWYLDDHPSPRLYKTGDLARYLPDGNIEFLGRNDLQVKLRGLRIELNDIEQQALHHPLLKRAAAIMHEGQLLLFYQADAAISHEQWREFLAGLLPLWMLPNAFIDVADWPLSGSGKTDRKALTGLFQPSDHYTKSQSATGRQVQAIWESCFGRPVSCDADFFAAGGHSLLAMRLVAQLAQAFAVELHFRDIFMHSTIASMAAYIDSLPKAATTGITPAAAAESYPASFQQQRLFLFQNLFPQSLAYNMPAAFDLHGQLDITALQQALLALIKRHTVLHTVYSYGDKGVWQTPRPDFTWQLAYEDLSGTAADIGHLAGQHGCLQFDLQHELPVKAAVYKLGDEHFLFCFCLHHIAGDALSLDILAHELATLYAGLTAQQDFSLPPLPLQYHDFASWQQQQNWQQALLWWQENLAGVPELLAIPHDRPRPLQQGLAGAQWLQELDSGLVEKLLLFCREQQLTPFMVLLSCLQVLLGKLARQQDVCVGVPVAGRDHPGLMALAGFFVNSIIVRSRQHANPAFSDFMQQQKSDIVAAFEHQEAPVEQVLASLGFTRATSHNPVAQVGFNFLQDSGTEALALSLPGLQATPVQSAVNTAKYELTWIFYQHDAGLRLAIEYNTGLFDEHTIEQWARHFQTLLHHALASPGTPLQQLHCLTDTETRQLLQQQVPAMEKCYALTATQRDIYLDSVLFPLKRHNQLGFLTHSTTALDIDLWRDVLEDLSNHADSLRARIVRTHHPLLDIAWQVIAPPGKMPDSCLHYQNHGTLALDETFRQQAIEQALFSPWPETEPLWRVHIHEFAGKNYLFILAAHHAMFDGVSIQMLGRLIKGNYQKRLQGSPADYPANNYADYVQKNLLACDTAATYQYWQAQAQQLQPYLDFRPQLAKKPAAFARIEQQLDTADWQKLQALCKSWRSSPPLFFKAVFALAIKAWHRMDGNFCFTEVVLGRDKDFYTTQGLFFQQQPNIIPSDAIHPDNTLTALLAALRQYRKQITPFTPVSLHLQHQLLPVPVPYLFNYYVMESATPFLGKQERIEHLMPEMDHAVNCIVKVIDERLHIELMYNQAELPGVEFLASLMGIIQQCLQGKTVIAELLPDLPATGAGRFSPAVITSAKTRTATAGQQRLPANAIEQQLLVIWQEVLGRLDISVDDNFFELGGHSLHAMRIASRLRELYTLELPLEQIFKAPSISAIALYLQQAPAHPRLPAISKTATTGFYPLSHAQKRLWFLTQLDQANMAYNIPAALQLHGPLDKAALRQALGALLQRHTLLHSVIDNSQFMPQWQVKPADIIRLEEMDCRQEQLQQRVNAEACQPFVISGQPLLRLKLLTLAQQQHVLLFTLHHLIGDARSLQVLARDLASLYHAFHHQQANPLPPLPLQYSDYTCWQQDLLQGDIIQAQLEYWKNELAQAPVLLGLPTDRPRPALQTFNGAHLAFAIPDGLGNKLRQLARTQGVTLFMLLLASYQLLLSQLCKQHDVCVGIPRDGRVSRELENLAGFFINALVIRTRFDADYTLPDLLATVRDKTLQAFAHELVPAEMVMQALHIDRQLQFMPIVQAAFNYLDAADMPAAFDLDGLQVSFIEPEITTAKFELLLTTADIDGKLQASLEFNTDLFDTATIERFRDGWLYLLGLISDNPAATVRQLHLPGHEPANEILCLQGMPAMEDFNFMQAFSRQAELHPAAIAVSCGNASLTYAELEQQSNALAQHLQGRHIKAGDRIGICMARRVELLVAILASIKCGACYIPMDVNYPPERLAYMLEDSAACLLLTENAALRNLPRTNASIMDIDLVDLSSTAPAASYTPGTDDLLYIIYTSGSTGLPKGAAVYHRSFANLLAWYLQEFGFNAADKTLVMSAIGFDLTQKNLFALLTVGGTVVLPDAAHFDVDLVLDCIEHHAITTLNCAPSAFYPLVELGGDRTIAQLRSLQTLLLGGEPLHLKRLAGWITTPQFNCSIVNMYGPTECTDISSFHRLTAEELEAPAADPLIPLGQPAAGVSLYVLNEQLQAVPNGLAGELCISGSSVGAGYCKQPELTAKAFVANPFSTGEHDRILYRTGDLARLDPDDRLLYFLGRKDAQVKLRGLRIEPGEIEHALRLQPAINDAVVLVEHGQLLAFVLSEQHSVTGWREALQRLLPDFMVPQLLLTVRSWPLTTHGKIDVSALLALPRPEAASLYVAPRSELEQDIARLWQQVLGISKAGIHDNFFEAGGDSLAALHLLAALEHRFGMRLPVAALFGAQTIAQLAQLMHFQLAPWSPIVPIQTQGTKTPIFAVHALSAMVLAYEPLARALGQDQPFYGIQAYGFEPGQTPFTDLNEMLDFYVAAIRGQQPHGPYQLIGHSFGGIVAIELARKLQSLGETVNFVGLLDTYLPANFSFTVDDTVLRKALQEQFPGLADEDFSRRAIAVVRGFQQMMAGFTLQPLGHIPLLLFTPQDLSARLLGVVLAIGQLRNIKTRGFEKISKHITVITVPGDHHSLLKVDQGDTLVNSLKAISGHKQ